MKLTSQTSVALDLIRGISGQLVLIGHLLSFYKIYGSKNNGNEFIIQNFGVLIFFILSGFLISYSINNKGRNFRFRNYFIDRFSRIYVCFFPALIIIYFLDLWTIHNSSQFIFIDNLSIKQFFGNLFMLQQNPALRYLSNYFNKPELQIVSFGSARPFWTIGIEWWVYMLFGFMVYKRFRITNILIWIFLLIWPLNSLIGGGASMISIVWFFGVFVYYLLRNKELVVQNSGKFIFLLFLAAIARLYFNGYSVYDYPFAIIITLLFFFLINELQYNSERYMAMLRYKSFSKLIASYSFSLYLLHYSIIMLVLSFDLNINIWIQLILTYLLSNVIAYLFASFTEFKYHEYRALFRKKLNALSTWRTEIIS